MLYSKMAGYVAFLMNLKSASVLSLIASWLGFFLSVSIAGLAAWGRQGTWGSGTAAGAELARSPGAC